MSIYPHKNLLGCKTIQDWMIVKKELPQLFDNKEILTTQRRQEILYFAMQKVALFNVCVASYKGKYQLLYGTQELQVILNFIQCSTLLIRDAWILPLPFPSKEAQCTFSSLSMQMRERLLATRIPHCDLIVSTAQEMEFLCARYSTGTSNSICSPML